MTPAEFQAAALGWLAAIATVAGVAIPLFFKTRAQSEEKNHRLDQHDEHAGIDTKPVSQPEPASTTK